MCFPSQFNFSFSPPRLTVKRKFGTHGLRQNLEDAYLASPKVLPVQPCRAGQEREPCGVATASGKWRVHTSSCSSLLKQNRSVELPRGLYKAESSTPQERGRGPIKKQRHSSLFMARDNCFVVCLFSIADRVNHTLYLHSRWEFGLGCCFVSCGLKQMGLLFIIMTSTILFPRPVNFQFLYKEFHHLPSVCLQGTLGITMTVRIKAWSTWKGCIRKVGWQLCTSKGNGQMCFGDLAEQSWELTRSPWPGARTKADITTGNMEVLHGLATHLSQHHNLPVLPAPPVPEIQLHISSTTCSVLACWPLA